MRRGTTPTIIFDNLPCKKNLVDTFYVTFVQRGSVVLEKKQGDPGVNFRDEDTIAVTLTQEETLSFSVWAPLEYQINFKLNGNKRASTDIITVPVEDTLKEGAI